MAQNKQDPAFLFYSSDFLTGVSFLDFEERGKYITILSQMHQHGRLSEESISFLVGFVSVRLKSKFEVDENGLWYNVRLENEIEKRAKFTESRRANGSQGGRGKKKSLPNGLPNEKLVVNHMEDENDNTNDIVLVNNIISENKKFGDMLLNDSLGTITYQNKISNSDAEELRTMFIMQQNGSGGEWHNNYREYSNHFINWAKNNISLLKPRQQSKTSATIDAAKGAKEILDKLNGNG